MAHIRQSQRTGSRGESHQTISNPILIVEDQRSIAMLLKGILEDRWGCDIHVATSLNEARERLQEAPGYLVALCDLNLPDAEYGEVIDVVTQAGVPAVALTGAFGNELRDTMLNKGVVDYVLKDSINAFAYIADLVGRLAKNRSVKVLVVDDSITIRAMLKQTLQKYGLQVAVAENGAEGLGLLEEYPDIQLMLVDNNMPVMDGFTLTIEARKIYAKDRLAIIGLSASNTPDLSARFLKNGANDFIYKPFHYEEVISRVNQNLEILELLQASQEAANRDFLTGLYNRRYFFTEGQRQLTVARACDHNIVAMMLDIDHFKKVNDTYGHDTGDLVIKHISNRLTGALQEVLVARLGGEEYAALCINMPTDAVTEQIEAMRAQLAEEVVDTGDYRLTVTVSIGLAVDHDPQLTLDQLLTRADENLYQAKESGRNRVVVS